MSFITNPNELFGLKKEVRKLIQKEAGDTVHIVLYKDESKIIVPKDIMACFENEPEQRLQAYNNLSEGEKKVYIDWINEAKKDDTKAESIIHMMDRLKYGLRLKDEFLEN